MNIAILGASRGLGHHIAELAAQNQDRLFLSSRKIKRFADVEVFVCDFSEPSNLEPLVEELKSFAPSKIWYVAGGGPYGDFAAKKWQDHLWAWQVSFLTPAFLIHAFLRGEFTGCEQFVAVGSAVAEAAPDPLAASYSASKHALKGLISSLKAELPEKDLRLFSPGYMNTSLLPPKALPRQKAPATIAEPLDLAKHFYEWAFRADVPWHYQSLV